MEAHIDDIIYNSSIHLPIHFLFLYDGYLITLRLRNVQVHPRQPLAHHISLIHREVHKILQHVYFLQVVINIYSHWKPSHASAPCALGTHAFKFQRICGSAGELVVHIFVSLV